MTSKWLPREARHYLLLFSLVGLALSNHAAAVDLSLSVLDSNRRPLKDAVVFLESNAITTPTRPMEGVEISQKGKTFIPQLTVVTVGTPIEFPNRDTVRHHVYSFSAAKKFELKLYIGKPKAPVVFDHPGVIELGCNIHDHMIAWILVLDTPVYGKTNSDGTVVFNHLNPGLFSIKVWHKDLPFGVPVHEYQQELREDSTQFEIVMKDILFPS